MIHAPDHAHDKLSVVTSFEEISTTSKHYLNETPDEERKWKYSAILCLESYYNEMMY